MISVVQWLSIIKDCPELCLTKTWHLPLLQANHSPRQMELSNGEPWISQNIESDTLSRRWPRCELISDTVRIIILEMRDINYCLSTRDIIIFWILAVLNCLTVIIMCYTTRKQCKRDGCLVWVMIVWIIRDPETGIPVTAVHQTTHKLDMNEWIRT